MGREGENSKETDDGSEGVNKALKLGNLKGWTPMVTNEDLDQRMMQMVQAKIYNWYKKAVLITSTLKRLVKKAEEFDPNDSYLTSGEYVFQHRVKYPISILDKKRILTPHDLLLSASDHSGGYDFGVIRAQALIEPYRPDDIKLSAPELYAPKFQQRANLLAKEISDSIFKDVTRVIADGLDFSKSYSEIANDIQQTMGVDPNNPKFPK